MTGIYCSGLFKIPPDPYKQIFELLEEKTLAFTSKGGLTFSTNRELIRIPFEEYDMGFKIEYVNEKDMRIYPYYTNPNDPLLPLPAKSIMRQVINHITIDIAFKGKILLEPDGRNYWKMKR